MYYLPSERACEPLEFGCLSGGISVRVNNVFLCIDTAIAYTIWLLAALTEPMTTCLLWLRCDGGGELVRKVEIAEVESCIVTEHKDLGALHSIYCNLFGQKEIDLSKGKQESQVQTKACQISMIQPQLECHVIQQSFVPVGILHHQEVRCAHYSSAFLWDEP